MTEERVGGNAAPSQGAEERLVNRRIFVPVDGSLATAQAIHYAGALARRTGARLLL